VLRINPDVGIGLRDYVVAEGLGKTRVVVCSSQEIGEGRKRVTAAKGAGISDRAVVVKEIDTHAQAVGSCLVRKVVDEFEQPVSTRRRGSGGRPEGSHAG